MRSLIVQRCSRRRFDIIRSTRSRAFKPPIYRDSDGRSLVVGTSVERDDVGGDSNDAKLTRARFLDDGRESRESDGGILILEVSNANKER
jgi:hypothetical protein